jgi:hypothetical protein
MLFIATINNYFFTLEDFGDLYLFFEVNELFFGIADSAISSGPATGSLITTHLISGLL